VQKVRSSTLLAPTIFNGQKTAISLRISRFFVFMTCHPLPLLHIETSRNNRNKSQNKRQNTAGCQNTETTTPLCFLAFPNASALFVWGVLVLFWLFFKPDKAATGEKQPPMVRPLTGSSPIVG
jgi:hypothetical protein